MSPITHEEMLREMNSEKGRREWRQLKAALLVTVLLIMALGYGVGSCIEWAVSR